jgi:hypothetical protein
MANAAHIKVQRIATRYIAEKMAQAVASAQTENGMPSDELEGFRGWFWDFFDFSEWAENQGYDLNLMNSSWLMIGSLLGLRGKR